jgi:hypothetical protein
MVSAARPDPDTAPLWRRRPKRPPVSRIRRLTSPLRVLPDFIILGEMRAGTTSLHHYLSEHPQVLQPWRKEIHYFDRLYANGGRWYRAHFPTHPAMRWHAARHGGQALTFEATPDYLIYPETAHRISRDLPGVKLIALLRDPVERAYSHFWMNVRLQRERHAFGKAIKREASRLEGEREKLSGDPNYRSRKLRRYSYALRGIYVDSLKAYDPFLRSGRLLVIKSEDLFARTQETFDEILRFVGLEPWQLRSTASANSFPYDKSQPPGYNELRDFFKPHNQRLYEYLGRDLGW